MYEQSYIKLYEEQSVAIGRHSIAPLNARRAAAYERFKKVGFPTQANEDYQYSRLGDVLDFDFGLNINLLNIPVAEEDLFHCAVAGINAHLSYMIDERFYAPTSEQALPEGVVFCSLYEAYETHREIVDRYLGQQIAASNDGFVAFNELFAQEGYFLYVPKNVRIEQPLQIINVLRSDVGMMINTRNLIVVEPGAEAKLLVCEHAIDRVKFFANRVTEAFVGENAHFEYYALENTHSETYNVSHLFVAQQASSRVVTNAIGLHNGTTRNHVELALDGEDAEAWIGGALVSDAEQQTENFTVIRHNKPNCRSNELFKYILDGKSHGIFTGRIIVAEDAQKTAAYQTNRNICLSSEAQMHSKPQLEIYADDVKCGHGATTGQLDEEAMFYMRARGIAAAEARMLLLMAFIAEAVDRVEVEALRERLKTMVERRLRGEIAGSAGCAGCGSCNDCN